MERRDSGRLELIRTLTPDVVLLDLDMPRLAGFQLIESLIDESAPKIVFVRGLRAYVIARRRISCHLRQVDGCPQ
jgi:YesN/AraC family two-component response regulator